MAGFCLVVTSVASAMQIADRISVNLEGPTQERLTALAPRRDLNRELVQMLTLAAQLRQQHPHEKLASSAVGDTDLELLSASEPHLRVPDIGPKGAEGPN